MTQIGLATPFSMDASADGSRDDRGEAWLGEVLLAIALDSLGADVRITLTSRDWERLVDLVRRHVATEAATTLERLSRDLERDIGRADRGLAHRLEELRARIELGYD
jgi:hypothetical protein